MAKPRKDEFLKFLRFDSKLYESRIASYLRNPRLVILLLLLLVIMGINAFITLPRNLNPEVKIPIVLITTVLPGAGPSDVESLITIPIEDSVNSLEGVKTVTSNSSENVSTVVIEFNSGIDPEKAKSDAQSSVDSVTDLPQDATAPRVVKLDFENSPVWTFVLTGSTDNASLFKFARTLERKLEALPEIDEVTVSGLEETEIQIVINPSVYASYGINPLQLSQAVTTGFSSFPAGAIRSENSNFSLVIDPQVVTIDDIRNLRINIGTPGQFVQNVALSEIAAISQFPKPSQNKSFIAYPESPERRAVTFSVTRVKTYNIDRAVESAKSTVDEEISSREDIFEAVTLINTSEEIDHQFSDLTRDFLITVLLVVLVLFIFLGARQAIVSSLSAPLSFLITFIVMQQTGITLNFLSLFSLILSLGLLVDDTVVVISAMSFYYKTGRFTPIQTGLLVWRDFLVPVFTTTITTVWAFLPLLLASGIIGEFIKSIPIVVSTALIASFFVAMFITLPLVVIFLKPEIPNRVKIFLRDLLLLILIAVAFILLPKGNLFAIEILALISLFGVVFILRDELKAAFGRARSRTFSRFRRSRQTPVSVLKGRNLDQGIISFEGINLYYKGLIEKILNRRQNRRMVVSMVVIFSIFSFLLLPLGFVKNEFFPKVDSEILYLQLEFAPGTHISKIEGESLSVLSDVKKTEGVNFASLDLGTSLNMESGGTQGSGNIALFSLNLTENNRPESFEIAENLREEFGNYSNGKISVIEQSGGPPVGADVQIKILGENLSVLDQKANDVVRFLENHEGVTNVEKSIKPGTSRIVFEPDKAILTEYGITLDQLGGLLRLYASGLSVADNKFPGDTEEQDITLRLYPNTSYVEDLEGLIIPTQAGNLPLASLGKFRLENNPTLITREDGNRTISVSAAVVRGFDVQGINSDLEEFADDGLNLPEGYSWKTGGVNEENEASVNSILQAMLLSFMLIIITMVIQFSSFRRAIIVMLVIPLSISGVFVLFALTGTPLSFPALIGVLALFGIVVKNSILIVDKILENQKTGKLPFIESISDAASSRLEPIALTTISTIFGLTPITLTDPLWRGLGGAIIAGLTFSGIIMLFFIPTVYFMWFNSSEKIPAKRGS